MPNLILEGKKFCYWVPYHPNGKELGVAPNCYVPGIVVENEPGYYTTDYNWGADREIAVQCATEINTKLGHSEDDVTNIVISSMARGRLL